MSDTWFDRMQTYQTTVVGITLLVAAFLNVAAQVLPAWSFASAQGQPTASGEVKAGLYHVETTMDQGYMLEGGIRYCEQRNYTKHQCDINSDCCGWDAREGACKSMIGNLVCQVPGLRGQVDICTDESISVALLNNKKTEDLCSSIVTARWFLAAGTALTFIAAFMFMARVQTKVTARVVAVAGSICSCVAFHIFIYSIHDELVDVFKIRYFGGWTPPTNPSWMYRHIYTNIWTSSMMVLYSAIFVFAFIVVLQFNHLLFDDRPPKIMNEVDLNKEILKIQQKGRDRSRSNQVSPSSTSETVV
jgi:hypothetical protein